MTRSALDFEFDVARQPCEGPSNDDFDDVRVRYSVMESEVVEDKTDEDNEVAEGRVMVVRHSCGLSRKGDDLDGGQWGQVEGGK